jgi:anti-anti-sigma factor
MPIKITPRIVSDVVILDLTGRFSAADAGFRTVVRERLDEGRQHFLLNLANVPYAGTWAISQMISIWTAIRAKEGTLGLVAPTKTVREVLHITRLDSIFPLYDTEHDALKALAK